MKKIIVIGCPGGGKSTFSKALHEATGIPLFHLDRLFWKPDRTTVPKSIFLERLEEVLRKESWIIDGNYASTMEKRMQECDTVFFLDYPVEICLAGIRERQGKPRSDLPWIETGEDTEFLEFIKNFQKESRPGILELLDKYAHKRIFVLKDRIESDVFLKEISKKKGEEK